MKEPEKVKLTQAEGEALIGRIQASDLVEEDRRVLERLIHMYFWLVFVVQEAKLSMKRLKALLFGKSNPTETKPKPKLPTHKPKETDEPKGNSDKPAGEEVERDAVGRRKSGGGKPPGQGRQSADAYAGAERVWCALEELQVGQRCPACDRGRLYRLPPGVEIRLDGQGFFDGAALRVGKVALFGVRAGVYGGVAARGRRGEVQRAGPGGAGVGALLPGAAVLSAGRLSGAGGGPGGRCYPVGSGRTGRWLAWPVFNELVYQAERLHEDDTPVRVLALIQENTVAEAGERRGMYTTGLVARVGEQEIWLYFSGRANAGENAGTVVQLRESACGELILMSDALSANQLEPAPSAEVIECFCLAHGQRQFSDIEEAFPEPCRHVLGVLEAVFEHERITGEHRLSAEQRLSYHQQHSGPLLQALHTWLDQQFEDRQVEPNSSLGKALNYLLNHWPQLTQFLRVSGAPIDNNIVEVRFVDPKPSSTRAWGMGPEPKGGNNRWLENLIPV